MVASNFKTSLVTTLGYEGGFVDDPRDPGGRTNKGVTQLTFNVYLRLRKKPSRDVKTITEAELEDLYKTFFWDKIGGDALPSGLDLVTFDYAVNSGVGRALADLRKVQARKLSDRDAISALVTSRLAFLERLRTWHTFGHGWASRCHNVLSVGLKLSKAPSTSAINTNPPTLQPASVSK